MTRLEPPRAVREIADRLEQAGFETWCVGGAVRDALLGHPHLDWDLATAARPEEVRRLFKRTVPVGIEFGTVGVLDRQGVLHEVTTFRRDVRTDGRHAVVEFGASLDEDLARRDFTINAIAYSASRDVVHDPFEGRRDLERRLVRAVGMPEERMREDRLRALRAIRFASRFDFEIEDATWRAIVASAPHLSRLSAERVKQELEKTMEQVTRPSVAMRRWKESGALAVLAPELDGVSDTTFLSLDFLPKPRVAGRTQRRTNRLAALVLELGASADRALKSLRFSNQDVAWMTSLATRWRDVGGGAGDALRGTAVPDDSALRRLAASLGRVRVAPFLRLAAARWSAERLQGRPAPDDARVRAVYRRVVRIAFRDPIELADLAVDGEDLRDAGIPPGPALGKILHALLDWVVADPARNVRDLLIAKALDLYRSMARSGEAGAGDRPSSE